jgi:SAM-dependent methyltransferase
MTNHIIPSGRTCRFCGASLNNIFVDLGMTPLSNAYLSLEQLNGEEKFYPLIAYVCSGCFLVQLEQFETPDIIFNEYAYFSSYSDSWLEHARLYTDYVVDRFRLTGKNLVVELASNDGYLLKNFIKKGIPVLGIEPAANVAEVAIHEGVPTIDRFFGEELAQELLNEDKSADLIVANNVLAHVPQLNDFVFGIKLLLRSSGIVTIEFPHLLRLMMQNQFDTIYHEHFSYFSLITVESVFRKYDMKIFDVQELPTHGGSLRLFACHIDDTEKEITDAVYKLLQREKEYGLDSIQTYNGFSKTVKRIKRDLLSLLIELKNKDKRIAGYGAAAKGNTLMNFCGVRTDFLEYVVDRSPYKQGKFLPGTHIPIKNPDIIAEEKPDYLLILPWNIKEEIINQNSFIRSWGGKFIVPIPSPEIID